MDDSLQRRDPTAVATGDQRRQGRPALRDGVEGVHLVVGRDRTSLSPPMITAYAPRRAMVPARAGAGGRCGAPRPGREVEDVDLGDRADEGVGLGRRAAACEHEAVPHDHGQEMITGARSVGEDGPRSGGGVVLVEPGTSAPLWPWLLPPTR